MASVSAIRDGIAARLRTISGLEAYDRAPEQINPPAAVVIPRQIAFDSTMARGSDDFVFLVQLVAGSALSDEAQKLLDGYLAGSGSESVKEAIDGDLGGLVDFAWVSGADNYGMIEWHGVQFLGVELTVNVTAEGTP